MNVVRNSKLVLPTPETCGWRANRSEDGSAQCGILSSIAGGIVSIGNVSTEQCRACCESYPPTPSKPNPVLASLLFSRLQSWKANSHSGNASISDVEVNRLIGLAQRFLLRSGEESNYLPIRARENCAHLGLPVLPDVHQSACGKRADEHNPTVFQCFHPAHKQTNKLQCAMCNDWSQTPNLSRAMHLAEIIPPLNSSCAPRHWAVGVTTAPRVESTLGDCVQGLLRAGWQDVHLFLDGLVRVPDELSYLPTTFREQPVGACAAWLMALAELVAINPTADAYALFQDDAFVHFGDSLREYLESSLWPGGRQSLVSLYNPGLMLDRGWHPIPSDWDWGTLAVVFPANLLREFLSDTIVLRRALPTIAGQHLPIPELLREWLRRRRLPVWTTSPSLAQHIGSTSTIWPFAGLGSRRTAPWFSAELEQPIRKSEKLSDFDESIFPPHESIKERYFQQIKLGERRMTANTVVICGLARDVRACLPRTASRIERLGGLFADYRVIVVENDSVDATGEYLADWQKHNLKVEIISEKLGMPKFGSNRDLTRMRALAMLRNRYLDRIRKSYRSFTHVIVVDMDLVGGWSFDGIAHSFGFDNWDFIGSNGLEQSSLLPQSRPRRKHYDNWALRLPSEADRLAFTSPSNTPRGREQALVPVNSCFGGVGIYKIPGLLTCDYGGSDCEHVVLHQNLRASGFSRQYMNPSQIVMRTVLIR